MGRRWATPLRRAYWNQDCHPFSQVSLQHHRHPPRPPRPSLMLTHWGGEVRAASKKVHQIDLQCPHSHSDDLWTHWMHNTCDTFNLPTKVFNVCFLRGFLLLCWMNQSITAMEKTYAKTAKLGARVIRLVAGCELPTSEERLTRWVLQPGGMNEQQSLYSHSLLSNLGKDLKVCEWWGVVVFVQHLNM